MKKLFIILFLLSGLLFSQTPDNILLGPGDGVSGGPASDDLSTNGQDAATTWKAFRWLAANTGDAYFFAIRMQSIINAANVADESVGFILMNDNNGEPGTLKMWGHEENYNFNTVGVGRHYFYIDSVASGQNRTITSGQYYWIAWISSIGNNGDAYFERQGSDPYPAWGEKNGAFGYSSPYTSTPPSGTDFDVHYDDNYYGWTIWGSAQGEDTTPPSDLSGFTASNATADSVRLIGTVTGETGAFLQARRIAYADRATLIDTTDGTLVMDWVTHGNLDTTILQDVSFNINYEYRVFAKDSVNNLSSGVSDSALIRDTGVGGDVTVTGTSGTIIHNGTIVISGSNFGSKSPAAPLMWDNCEDRTVNSEQSVLDKGWSDLYPRGSIDSCELRYRNAGFRSVATAHTNSTKYLAGCHYQYANNSPPYIGSGAESYLDVMATVDAGSGQDRWFATWYYRLDPNWYTGDGSLDYNNHKISVLQSGVAGYTPSSGFAYMVFRSPQSPANTINDSTAIAFHAEGSSNIGSFPNDYGYGDNPRLGWVRYEERVMDDDELGNRIIYFDNELMCHYLDNNPDWFTEQGGAKAGGIRSFTVGGYYRFVQEGGSIANVSDYRGGVEDSNWRYFDDIYIDNTLSRVILGNASTYTACTITEPQPPTTWGTTSITVTVNQGKLSAGTVYLYVFDSDGNYNENGLSRTLTETLQGSFGKLKPKGVKIQ